MMNLIGIHGKKRSGKDTTAMLMQTVLSGVRTMAFGDRMKEICSMVYGVPIRYFYDQDLKEGVFEKLGVSPRSMMLTMDGELKAKHGDDFFVKVLQHEMFKLYEIPVKERPKTVIITDVRFEAEADWIRNEGGKIIRVTRPSVEAENASTHWSEAGLPDHLISYELRNESTLPMLLTSVISMVSALKLA